MRCDDDSNGTSPPDEGRAAAKAPPCRLVLPGAFGHESVFGLRDRCRYRPRYGQHLRFRARSWHRPQRTLHRRLQHCQGVDRSGWDRGARDARAHAREHQACASDEGRRHCGLRRRGEDADALRAEGAGQESAAPAAAHHWRAPGDHAGRAPRGQGQRLSRQGERSAPRRRADGGGDWFGPPRDRSGRQHDHRHRRRHDRHRRHLAGGHRLRALAPRRRQRAGRGDHFATCAGRTIC